MSGAAISRSGKKQTVHGTAEADEYIFEDNQSAIGLAKIPQFPGRAEHIGIKYHFIQ